MTAFDLIRPYFRANLRRIATGLLFLLGVDAFQLFIPRIVKHAVDALSAGTATPHLLARDGGIIVCFAMLIGVFRFGWRHCLIGTSRRVERAIRSDLFSHLLTLDARYFDTTRTGDLMSHATSDINNIRMATGMGIVAVTDAVVLGGAAIGFMAWIHPGLTLMALIPMPFIVLSARVFGRRMHARHKAVQEGLAAITEHVREAVDGIRVVKVFGRGKQVDHRLKDLSGDYVRRNLRLVRVTGSLMPLMIFLSGMGTAIVVGAGGRLVITGGISPGDFVAFISYLGLLTWPMMALGWMTNLVQRGKASLDRLAVIFNERPEVAEPRHPTPIANPTGRLDMEKVFFSFNGSRQVLRHISLAVESGKSVGVVGPPGSGKTALLSLLVRLYDPTGGTIRMDGVPLPDLATADVRRLVRFMPQEPWLFSGTIEENICGPGAHADARKLDRAVTEACLAQTIEGFEDGLNTIVGEKGVMLSGGQKQRVALARTLYDPSPVLILDDPVSQVDTRTAHHIIEAVFADTGRTLVVASHRFAAIVPCDEILVMEEGRIRARGSHEHLLKTDDYYRETWRLQSLALEIEEADHA
ncbi:ABC transporter ATP-binding protein [Desulfoluna butyratoxydans]|uniref:Abc transporter transmembrane region n=1 Tax=Desulfoluna butyratoxydans TaxID=231438 RepID=A0A4U8YSK6_9BACT|nr:ABC transporter ATP-binding protein [Desulfoluna butyratoxydans]VFQ44273.1 abc transporter transmembrane region [Desulfoluna butyratoxydans]